MVRSLVATVAVVTCAVGCDANSDPSPSDRPAASPPAALADAGPSDARVKKASPARTRVVIPPEGFHLDDSGSTYSPRRHRATVRQRSEIHITLKSTPSGAMAAVDGVPVGRTPALWQGELTGELREFTFVLPGYAMARYRFVPTTSGIVHGTLKRLPSKARSDAGSSLPPRTGQ